MLNTAHAATTRADHRCPRADRDRAAARAARRARGAAALRPLRARRPRLPRDVRRRRPDRPGRGAGAPSTASTPSCTSARCRPRRRSRRSPARTCTAPSTSSRPAGARACGASSTRSSNHATGMYAPGEPLDGAQPPRPDGLYGASKVWGEALGRLYVDKFGLEVVCLRIGSFQPRPRERRELATWLSHADGDPALPGVADRRRRRLRDRLRRLGQHAPLVAGRRAGRLRAAGRRGGASPTSSPVPTTTTRAARSRCVTPAAGRRERRRPAGALRRPGRARHRPRGGAVPARRRDAGPAAARARGARPRPRRPALQARAAGLAAGDRHAAVRGRGERGRRAARRAARPGGGGRAARAADDRGRASDHRRAGQADRRPALPAHAWTSTATARGASSCPACTCTCRLGGADRTLAVYNALRSHLPELAALAANAPFHAGRDTGLASIRPTIAVGLQRQGVPPAIPSWEWFADALSWGERSDTVPDARRWWFELRLHATYGTLELRAPDAQSSVDDVHGVAAFAFALIHSLAARYDAGEPLPVHDAWRIDENRWAAMRDGVDRHARRPGDRRARRHARAPAVTGRGAAGRLHAHARADRGQRRRPHPRGGCGRRRRLSAAEPASLSRGRGRGGGRGRGRRRRTTRSRAARPPARPGR